jgi:2,5-dioxopentanoate dehydrogenase
LPASIKKIAAQSALADSWIEVRTYQNFIAGEWVGAQGGARFQNMNPADTREVVADYPKSGEAEAKSAIEAARAAQSGWGAQTPVARGRVLSKASEILAGRKNELAELLTREEGKTLAEAQGEVQRAADIFRFFGGLSSTLFSTLCANRSASSV